ncbi:hypothetical protein [Paraprevotella clara]|uniref:hypothetical protein n=1 Tax=Paraprevotella clara TaxID=454154 RepID=UPI003AF87B85
MIKDYEDFKKFILSLTTIDLNAYKEKQMKRRIDTLIARLDNSIFMFHSSVHLTPHPYPVGKHQHKQGDKEPQDDTQRRHHPRCRLQTPQFTVFQRHIQVLFFRKVITTPFVIHRTLF